MEWILLVVTAWVAATISGVAGFGGSLIMLPLASHIMGAKQAIPALTVAWLMGNLSRALLNLGAIRWKPVWLFSSGAVPAAFIGAKVFVELPASLILKAIGVFLIGTVIIRHTSLNKELPPGWLVPTGVLVGFLSAIIGSAGPIGAAAFLSLNLPPVSYIASEAVTAVFMHVTKTAVYGRYELLSGKDLLLGIELGLAMVAGSWTAKKFLGVLSRQSFLILVETLLVVSAVFLLIQS